MWVRLYAIYLIWISAIAFCLYAIDKKRAREQQWRISEATLIIFSLIGGGVGGYLAMQIVRHKTKHWYFHLVNILGILWQISLLVVLLLI